MPIKPLKNKLKHIVIVLSKGDINNHFIHVKI